MIKSYSDYTYPMKNPNHRPYKHQIKMTEFLLRNRLAYNLSDIGTGKTLSALWATDILFEMGMIKKVLIIAPLTTLQVVWAKEIFTNFVGKYYAIAHGPKQKFIEAINSDVHYIITNHDAVKFKFDELAKIKFDIIIVDELTAFKNISTDRHKSLKKLMVKTKGRWGLTGAPTPNSPVEAFGQARIINPKNHDLPPYLGQYKDIVIQEVAQGVWVPTIHAQAMVHKILQPAIRFTRDECLDIPPVTAQSIPVIMIKEQKRIYEDMKRNLYAQYDEGQITAVNAGVKLTKLLQISAGAVYDDDHFVCYLDDPKYDAIINIFNELNRTKLIVIAAFVNVAERLTEMFKKDGIRSDCIYGKIKNRASIINSFQEDPNGIQILVIQPQAVAHGITLTAANTIVWHSYIHSGEVHLQVNGRITRMGQLRKQYIQYLHNSKADESAIKRLRGKQAQSDSVLELFAKRML